MYYSTSSSHLIPINLHILLKYKELKSCAIKWELATDPQGQGDLEQGCIVWKMNIKMLPGGGAILSLHSWSKNLKNQDLEPKIGGELRNQLRTKSCLEVFSD